jgi:hypothetical protein
MYFNFFISKKKNKYYFLKFQKKYLFIFFLFIYLQNEVYIKEKEGSY